MPVWETTSPDEMDKIGKAIASQLRPGDTLLLHGGLGAGKTTLSKSIIHTLTGIDKTHVNSPTFTYVNEYNAVYHFDLYRLRNAEEFFRKGLDDYFHEESICLVEWPERCPDALPPNARLLHITLDSAGKRTITLEDR